MYVPKHFAETDRETLYGVIRNNPFGLLIGSLEGAPFATHLPFLLDGNRLLGHFARGNPHWKAIDGTAAMLAVFSGPHGYVSPRWYRDAQAVPTWNYVAVHVVGKPSIVDDARAVRAMLDRLVGEHERGAWTLDDRDPTFLDRMMRGIVAFELPVERIEGKFKLSQNRPETDREQVGRELSASDDPSAAALGRLMTQWQAGK